MVCLVRSAWVAGLLITLSAPANAATTFAVNTGTDNVDLNSCDGICDVSGTQQCSLRAAISEANCPNVSQPVTITIDASAVPTVSLTIGFISIRQTVTIQGVPFNGTLPTIDANKGSRIFSLTSTQAGSPGHPASSNYPFLSDADGTVLDHLHFTNGLDNFGGAIFAGTRLTPISSFTIQNCLFDNNVANYQEFNNWGSGSGGAIYSSFSVLIKNTTFQHNWAANAGGAIYIARASGDPSPDAGGRDGDGWGSYGYNPGYTRFPYEGGTLQMVNSRVINNTATFRGAGIVSESTGADVRDSVISSNVLRQLTIASGDPTNSPLQLDLNFNFDARRFVRGAGLFIGVRSANGDGPEIAYLSNLTVAGNQANTGGVATLSAEAGGIFAMSYAPDVASATGQFVTMNNLTIADNVATTAVGLPTAGGGISAYPTIYSAGPGLGVVNAAEPATVISNCIIARNTNATGDNNCGETDDLQSAAAFNAAANSAGFNLLGPVCNVATVSRDQTNAPQASLGLDAALLSVGGAPETLALQLGSPAIDRGNPAAVGGGAPTCEDHDQRQLSRPQDGATGAGLVCDIGAYEFEYSVDVGVVKVASASSVNVGDQETYSLLVTNNDPTLSAPDVIVTDSLPSTLALVSAATSVGSCSSNAPITCTLGTLAAGASVTITIVTTVTAAGSIANTGTVTHRGSDPNGGNDTSTVTITSAVPPTAAAPTPPPTTPKTPLTPLDNGLFRGSGLAAGCHALGGDASLIAMFVAVFFLRRRSR